jgi:hypothetical protein
MTYFDHNIILNHPHVFGLGPTADKVALTMREIQQQPWGTRQKKTVRTCSGRTHHQEEKKHETRRATAM